MTVSKFWSSNNSELKLGGRWPRSWSLSSAGGAAAAWTPVELFASGETGAWYDPSDLSTLWQDTTGTVPVTADGQTVARMDDLSGNGINITQSSVAKRPLYKTAGGLHWLEGDGVDDSLTNTTGSVVHGVNGYAGFAAFRRVSGAIVGLVISGDDGTTRASQIIRAGTTNLQTIHFSPGVTTDTGAALTNGVDYVARMEATPTSINTFLNGVAGIPTAGAFTMQTALVAPITVLALRVTADFINARFYGGGFVNRPLTAGEKTDLDAYLAGKSGVTL